MLSTFNLTVGHVSIGRPVQCDVITLVSVMRCCRVHFVLTMLGGNVATHNVTDIERLLQLEHLRLRCLRYAPTDHVLRACGAGLAVVVRGDGERLARGGDFWLFNSWRATRNC